MVPFEPHDYCNLDMQSPTDPHTVFAVYFRMAAARVRHTEQSGAHTRTYLLVNFRSGMFMFGLSGKEWVHIGHVAISLCLLVHNTIPRVEQSSPYISYTSDLCGILACFAHFTLVFSGLAHCEKPQPLAMFYGSGKQFADQEIRVPCELQWSLDTLERNIGCGALSLLDVVEAIKTAMPADWLAAHNLASDSLSISFSMTDKDLFEVYKSALNAWGAADIHDMPQYPVEKGEAAPSSRAAAAADAQPSLAVQQPVSGSGDESLNQGLLLLQLLQFLTYELELCSSTLVDTVNPGMLQTVLSITALAPLQSTLVSSMFKAASSRNSDIHCWRAFARQLPHVLDHSCRLHLFRHLTQTTPDHLMALRQDRVNNVDREHLLDWAAAIVAAIRGRRNPLMIQYAQEAGFGEAITASFFSEVADSFAYADLGMWYVHGDDAPEEFQSDAAHRLLLASNGLYPQPYCAARPMPSNLLHNFKLLGCMMGKALHDGRAFPLRISYALARCICGQELRFEDLGAFLSPKQFDCISRLRAFVEGSTAFPSDAVDCFGDFQLFCYLPDADSGRLVVRSLELVPDGRNIDLCEANAPLFLKAFERVFLRDGVALQIRSLRDGFYSVVSREAVSILGASGLLRELYCLEVAPFDEEDVKFGMLPVNGYNFDSPQFQWLIKSILQFNAHERTTFLRWVRGGPSLPAGFRGLPKRITVQGMHLLNVSYFVPASSCSHTWI